MTTNYKAQAQKLQNPSVIELYTINTSTEILRFVTGPRNQKPIRHAGNIYYQVPIKATGFEFSSSGAFPRPRLKISNVDSLLIPVIATTQDLIGAKFTRLRIFATNLDGEPDEAPDQTFPRDQYVINKKLKQTRESIEWELAASIDQEGVKLPKRQVLRDYCQSIYRVFDSNKGVFDYSFATCPYTQQKYFTHLGEETGARCDDSCGKTLADCKKRFGEHAVLPFDGFPGVARVRKK